MKKYAAETTVGIFVVIGLLCVGYLTVKLGKVDITGSGYYPVLARFTSVSGLRVGSSIEMFGLRVGSVEEFTMDQENQMALVKMKIQKGVKITDDAIASIRTSGLIGDKFINIAPGASDDYITAGGTITDTEPAIDIGELLAKYAFGDVEKK